MGRGPDERDPREPIDVEPGAGPDPARDGYDEHDRRMMTEIYREIRRIAQVLMRGERPGHTLAPTEVVHDVWLQLARSESLTVKDERHLRALYASAMRRYLKEYARRRGADKRGGGWQRVTLMTDLGDAAPPDVTSIDVAQLLDRLEEEHERVAQALELRYFGGLTAEEIADELEISRASVNRDLRFGRAWLRRHLKREGS